MYYVSVVCNDNRIAVIISGHPIEFEIMPAKRQDDDLILIKASQAWPFVDTLARLGGPVAELCRQAGMPLNAVRSKRGVIGGISLWRFVKYASEYMNLDHFGYLTAVEHPVDSAGQLGGFRLRMAPTLDHMLRCFVEDIHSETTGTRYSLKQEDGQTWFERDPVIRDRSAGWQAEQYVIMFVVQMIRIYAGQKWLPSRLWISSQPHPVGVPAEWLPIEIEWGQPTTAIHIGADVLALENPEFAQARDRSGDNLEPPMPLLHIENLVDRQIWTKETGITNAASELGVSETTLKRRLRNNNQSYSALLKNRRQYWAKHLLREPNVPIKDIARTLGYAHTGNFTRAFARIENMSPTEFRLQVESDDPTEESS